MSIMNSRYNIKVIILVVLSYILKNSSFKFYVSRIIYLLLYSIIYSVHWFYIFIWIYFIWYSLMSHIKLFMLLPNYNNNRVNRKFTYACYTTQSRQTVCFNEIFVKKKPYKSGTIIRHNNNNRCKVLQHLCQYG